MEESNWKKQKKKFGRVFTALMVLWILMALVDYTSVFILFKKPVLARLEVTADDGGSGVYLGPGYAFQIKGNFMPEDEFPGVTHATYSIFGIEIANIERE